MKQFLVTGILNTRRTSSEYCIILIFSLISRYSIQIHVLRGNISVPFSSPYLPLFLHLPFFLLLSSFPASLSFLISVHDLHENATLANYGLLFFSLSRISHNSFFALCIFFFFRLHFPRQSLYFPSIFFFCSYPYHTVTPNLLCVAPPYSLHCYFVCCRSIHCCCNIWCPWTPTHCNH